jgi:MFS transporter, PPP family, 3-phenylpropionic acid transporter
MTTQPASPFSPEARTTVYYLTLFMSMGASTVYSGIWFDGRGLTSEQIGIINALPVFSMLILNIVAGRIADRATDWRQVIVWGSVASGLVSIGLMFVAGFWGILTFWTLTAIAIAAVIPVVDAAAMRMTSRRGTDFGAMRAFGTIGYLAVILITGVLTNYLGPGAFLPVFIGLSLARAAAALLLPNFRADPAERRPQEGAISLLHVMKPWFLLPLVGWAVISSTHLILNAFQGLLFQRQGIGISVTSIIIALGAVSEAAMFFAYKRFFQGRYRARTLILISALITAARWLIMAFEPGVPVLIALQLLHGITFGLGFMACITFITNWTSEDIAAEAQSFFVVLQQAMSVLALAAFGGLADRWGAQAYFASAAFAGIGTALIWASLRLQPPGKAATPVS